MERLAIPNFFLRVYATEFGKLCKFFKYLLRQMLRTLADVLADGDMVQLDQVVCPLEHAGGIAQIGIFAGL